MLLKSERFPANSNEDEVVTNGVALQERSVDGEDAEEEPIKEDEEPVVE